MGAGHHSSRVLWALGAIHQWWLLVRRPVGIILGQRHVVVLGGRRRIVVQSWPGVVFRRHVRSVVAWSVVVISHCMVVHCGHGVIGSMTMNDDQCRHSSFGCHVAIGGLVPDSDVKKWTGGRGCECSPGRWPSWLLPDIVIHRCHVSDSWEQRRGPCFLCEQRRGR